jgi:hypothetical protein
MCDVLLGMSNGEYEEIFLGLDGNCCFTRDVQEFAGFIAI